MKRVGWCQGECGLRGMRTPHTYHLQQTFWRGKWNYLNPNLLPYPNPNPDPIKKPPRFGAGALLPQRMPTHLEQGIAPSAGRRRHCHCCSISWLLRRCRRCGCEVEGCGGLLGAWGGGGTSGCGTRRRFCCDSWQGAKGEGSLRGRSRCLPTVCLPAESKGRRPAGGRAEAELPSSHTAAGSASCWCRGHAQGEGGCGGGRRRLLNVLLGCLCRRLRCRLRLGKEGGVPASRH